ncbi:MAG: tyrosine-type recombinase/integrase [Chloroflexi bacterium]|nr:tyrosine-type recombinase/integrase [Chloroflexota bacterium]
MPDDPVALKMLLVEAVSRGSGVETYLVYGDQWLRNAADVSALPDDPAMLKMLLMEAVNRGRRLTNSGLGRLEPGRHYVGDGTGLFVDVSEKRKVSFGQRLRIAGTGKRIELGLGSWPAFRLEEVKTKAVTHQRMARHGKNPLLVRAEVPTVAEAVEEFFKEFGPSWVGRNTERAYRASLAKYVLPRLGARRVDQVRRSDLAAAVKPAWVEYRRVGRDLLRVLRGTFRWVRAHDFRNDLPTDGVEDLLPRIEREERHHEAMSHEDVAEAVARARMFENHVRRVTPSDGMLALAFEMTILTGLRRQELVGIRWGDIDGSKRVLTIDAHRMKKKTKAHMVPLSSAAMDVLRRARELGSGTDSEGDRVFAYAEHIGDRVAIRPISPYSLSRFLQRLGLNGTLHGFRSALDDWATEKGTDAQIVERALGHAVKSKVRRAYSRTDLLERRRALMEAWGEHATRACQGGADVRRFPGPSLPLQEPHQSVLGVPRKMTRVSS